ncbi:hypothetical protein [uncultured Sphingomonas sp.]|uniref:hypothetical protein n=1 Tax=uncultured Sphingomonas sp. TaxID=158754 RepID=UPI0035C95E7C
MQAAQGAPALGIAWDAGNGATGWVIEHLTATLHGEHHLTRCDLDGRFPTHHPNLANLQALARHKGLDLGIAFDSDGDRIGVIDASGDIVWPDQFLLYLAQVVLTREAMLREGAPIAGQARGRIFFAENWYGTDDAVCITIRPFAAIGRLGSLTTWRKALRHPDLRLLCPDSDKARVLAGVGCALIAEGAEIDRTEGSRFTTPDGW